MVQVHALEKDLYCQFNFGKNRELMIQICEDLELRMKQLAKGLAPFTQRPKNLGSRVALLPGKFLRVWKVFRV